MRGRPICLATLRACLSVLTVALLGVGSPMSAISALNSSRSSAFLIVWMGVPRLSTLYLSRMPASARSTARFKPVCPPRVGNNPSGRSFSMMRPTISTVSGSI
ncbi:hypothetical protein ES703_71409 [subsurface metagenome]